MVAVSACFCPVRGLKQKEQTSAGSVVFCITAAFVLKNEDGFLYKHKWNFLSFRRREHLAAHGSGQCLLLPCAWF